MKYNKIKKGGNKYERKTVCLEKKKNSFIKMCIGAIIHEHELSSSILLIEIVNHVKLI